MIYKYLYIRWHLTFFPFCLWSHWNSWCKNAIIPGPELLMSVCWVYCRWEDTGWLPTTVQLGWESIAPIIVQHINSHNFRGRKMAGKVTVSSREGTTNLPLLLLKISKTWKQWQKCFMDDFVIIVRRIFTV